MCSDRDSFKFTLKICVIFIIFYSCKKWR
jgi:hypothetical protein